MTSITDLPDEVLEFILTLVSPYQDLHDCMLVSKRWKRCVQNVVKLRRRNLNKSIVDFNIKWTSLDQIQSYPIISKRYSHSAVVHDNIMYVFGGCTCSMTTFNDLWTFNLSKREWHRPLTTGTYPSPKACSSLIFHKDKLVLFGGWTYPPSYPLYQSWHLFNELHVYNIEENHWRSIDTLNSPSPIAGHSVSVIEDRMIVFGGLSKPGNAIDCEKTNEVWLLDLINWIWTKKDIDGIRKPEGRFGQTQIVLDNKNLFIIGGSSGSNTHYSDAWILNMTNENSWKWIPVEIRGKANKPSNIWSNPGCKIDLNLIVLNKLQTDIIFPLNSNRCPLKFNQETSQESLRIDSANRNRDLDQNVNGRRGSLRSSSSSSQGGVLNRLDILEQNCLSKNKRGPLGLYVLDLQNALNDKPYVTWLTPKNFIKGPEETILYTLVEGKSEIIMFGGIQNEFKTPRQLSNLISNSVHFISAKDHII